MRKFLLGVLVGLFVAVAVALVLVFAVGRFFESRQPTIASNSVLVLALNGDIPETAPVDIPIPFMQSQSPPTVRDMWTSLRQAATDDHIRAVVLQPRGLDAGWGKLQEFRQ